MKSHTGKSSAFGLLTVSTLVVFLAACAHPRPAAADQPQMHAALSSLKEAERHLEKATTDKGGHRAKALELVRDAIREVNRGIAYDRRN
ncbi:MAG: hypothetical protein HY942_07380 [Gammaproteobacteria bacterium]|nr:hypothetical protein [Gammaproteobacteria bacterium]